MYVRMIYGCVSDSFTQKKKYSFFPIQIYDNQKKIYLQRTLTNDKMGKFLIKYLLRILWKLRSSLFGQRNESKSLLTLTLLALLSLFFVALRSSNYFKHFNFILKFN